MDLRTNRRVGLSVLLLGGLALAIAAASAGAVQTILPTDNRQPSAADEVGPDDPPDVPVPTSTPELRPSGSRVEERAFYSAALDRNMSYLIYLPPGYDRSDRRYPTLYLLHGVAGDSTEWPSIGVPAGADRLLADDAIEPMLIVFPYGDAGYYVNNQPNGLRWYDYLVNDVVASVDASYRTLPTAGKRAIGGLSMGGDGALQIAMREPDRFGIAGAHSPSSRLLFEHVPEDVYGNVAFFRSHNPYWLAQDAPGAARIQIWIDVGDEDPWRWNVTAIHAALTARGISHEFHILPGQHEGDYWVANVDRYLQFYDTAFARS